MSAVFEWIKNIICCICVLELLYHIVQNTEYQRYLRFFGGIIFILMTAAPLLNFWSFQDVFDEALRMSLLQEEVRDMEEAAESLGELQNEKIEKAYQEELERQIEEVVRGHGQVPLRVEITLGGEETAIRTISQVEIELRKTETEEEEEREAIKTEISAIYGVDRQAVFIL